MMKRFVMAGLGVSFLAASNCAEEVSHGRMATVSLSPEPMMRKLGLIYRKDKALSKAALGFIQVILEHAGGFPSVSNAAVVSSPRPIPKAVSS
jgi:DNA-binding transcriptional LysR family regulator